MELEYTYIFKDVVTFDFISIFLVQIQGYRVFNLTSLILHFYILSSTLRIRVLKDSKDELKYPDLSHLLFHSIYTVISDAFKVVLSMDYCLKWCLYQQMQLYKPSS